ncbi:adenylate/guanylate cyclase domain-containing protein [Vacuolonema iberomarrocanum]|uniref:adenylate/guanylate cyclase domain-containing protein n=1 Tax=Vacuolonema iberomarrocanum TaxID=3454632 RepID=UPI003F6DAA59
MGASIGFGKSTIEQNVDGMSAENTKVELERLLQLRNEEPKRALEIEAQIHQRFGITSAVFVLDLAGFSRLTLRYGIVHFLGVLQRLRAIAYPILKNHGGTLIKQEADNLFVTFPEVEMAVKGAIAILQALQAANVTLPDAEDVQAGIGIGYGDLLLIGGCDLFGSEMNLASKLGEDLARPGEILLTQRAMTQLMRHNADLASNAETMELTASGLAIPTYQFVVRRGVVQIPES